MERFWVCNCASSKTAYSKSKSKCIFMCGSVRNVQYPAALQLYGVDLPWVETATHLGHELHQLCNMDYDVKTKRAQFIANSTDIRDIFQFANPDQILRATNLYCGHCYGSMLWDLSSEMAGQFFQGLESFCQAGLEGSKEYPHLPGGPSPSHQPLLLQRTATLEIPQVLQEAKKEQV